MFSATKHGSFSTTQGQARQYYGIQLYIFSHRSYLNRVIKKKKPRDSLKRQALVIKTSSAERYPLFRSHRVYVM